MFRCRMNNTSAVNHLKVEEQPQNSAHNHRVNVGHDEESKSTTNQSPHLIAAIVTDTITEVVSKLLVPHDDASTYDQNDNSEEK